MPQEKKKSQKKAGRKTNHIPRYDIQTEYKFIYSNNGGKKVAEQYLQSAQRKLLSTYNCEPYNTVLQNWGEIDIFNRDNTT